MTMLALNSWLATAIALAVTSLVVLLVIVIAPSRAVREEPPLDDTIETRLLLGEDPAEIAEDEDTEDDEARVDEPDLRGPAA
ncbi:MAG: hypothetical protein ACRDZ1_19000 [Acidimicrobiia bacterium]|jgi:hypothetical protein